MRVDIINSCRSRSDDPSDLFGSYPIYAPLPFPARLHWHFLSFSSLSVQSAVRPENRSARRTSSRLPDRARKENKEKKEEKFGEQCFEVWITPTSQHKRGRQV